MANTKSFSRAERKHTKRRQRRATKALVASLTSKDQKELARSEKTLKVFLKEKGRI